MTDGHSVHPGVEERPVARYFSKALKISVAVSVGEKEDLFVRRYDVCRVYVFTDCFILMQSTYTGSG